MKAAVGHAHILVGSPRAARYTANQFAQALQCTASPATDTACGTCISCRVFASGNHPDVLYVTGSKTTSIGVDDVRGQVILPMATQPFRYKYKIFVIEKADTLTPEAQNALLKTIEEPAPYGVFLLLVSQVDKLLPTVLSRCVTHKITDADIPSVDMSTNDMPTDGMDAVVNLVINAGLCRDVLDALQLYQHFEPYKDNREQAQALLDALYAGYGRQAAQAATGLDGRLADTHWLACTQVIARTKQILQQNGNFQLAIEVLLLALNKHMA